MKKKLKTTEISFNEADPTTTIYTYNTKLKKRLLSSIRKPNKQKVRMAIQTTLCLVMHFLMSFSGFVQFDTQNRFFLYKKGLPQTILLICDSPIKSGYAWDATGQYFKPCFPFCHQRNLPRRLCQSSSLRLCSQVLFSSSPRICRHRNTHRRES